MFNDIRKELDDVESKLKDVKDKKEIIDNIYSLKINIKKIIDDKIVDIEKNYGLDSYIKENYLESETYESYMNKNKSSFENDLSSYELAKDYKEYSVFDGYKYLIEKILIEMGIDINGKLLKDVEDYGIIKEEYKKTFEEEGFENDVFYIRPYNWRADIYGGCNYGLYEKLNELYESIGNEIEKDTICSKGFHSKWCEEWDVIFCYKPTGLKIKSDQDCLHLFEKCVSNHPLNENILMGILNHCKESKK